MESYQTNLLKQIIHSTEIELEDIFPSLFSKLHFYNYLKVHVAFIPSCRSAVKTIN
jgi:hypothetical protein